MAATQTDTQTRTLADGLFAKAGPVGTAQLETVSVGTVTRADLARARYLHELERGHGALELSPAAYTEAIQAGWLSPASAGTLWLERDRLQGELDTLRLERARLEIELETACAERDRLRDELETARNQRAQTAASWCLPSRNLYTAG